MGGDRVNNERRPRERDDRDATKERTQRTFDKDAEEADGRPRNGLSRGKSEPWFKNEAESKPSLTNRERIDRAKSWRDRENKDTETFESNNDRTPGRSYDRRWDRDQRTERAPEWAMEEPGHKAGGHTEEDFKKFMEHMKAGNSSSAASAKQPLDLAQLESSIKAEQPAVASAPAVESGPDKFFMAFGGNTGLNVSSPRVEVDKEPAPQASKPGGGKSSRFTSFFSPAPQDESAHSKPVATESPNPLAALMGGGGNMGAAAGASGSDNEKQAFQVLLQKLQRSGVQGSTPPAAQLFQQPSQAPPQDSSPAGQVRSPSGYPQFAPPEQRSDSRTRQPLHEIHAPRPVMPVHPSSHQDKLLQDLVERQRQQASSQGSGRPEVNRNTEFLMNLMKSQPDPIRTEQMLVRDYQQRNPSISHMPEREPDFARQGGRSSQPPMRGQPPPGFMEEQFHRGEPDNRQQPTQILQRPPPPGLDQMGPGWMAQGGGGPIPPQQQRNMGPPPGLAGGPGGPGGPARNHPGMPGMFAPGPGPNFPPGAGFPPPENMSGPPPRGMPPPPGFFGGPPPPGFMGPPGMAGPGFGGPGPGPDGPGFPFDGRGMPPPPGAAQAFRRQ